MRGLPTCIVFVNGTERARLPGAHGKPRLRALIEASAKDSLSTEEARVLATAALENTFLTRNLAEAQSIARLHPEILAAESEDHMGPVAHAVYFQANEIAEMLARHAPRLNHRELAALGRTLDLAERLGQARGGIPDVPGRGLTALALAAIRGHEETARFLLAAGFSPNTPCGTDAALTPLMLAVASGQTAIARLLIEAGADASRPPPGDSGGLLHAAVRAGDAEMLELLLNAPGIDRQVLDKSGRSAQALARQAGREDLMQMLGR